MSFKVGDTVVYPHHGAARIEEIETRSIKGEDRTYLVLKVDKGDLTVRVPADNAELVGVRDVVGQEGLERVFEVLRAPHTEEPTNWSRRYKANLEKLASGDVNKVAEVVRDLWRRDRERGLSAGEKRMLAKARQILVTEPALAEKTNEDKAEALLDAILASPHCLRAPVPHERPRVGVGVDVHPFGPGRELYLAGLFWPGEEGLVGHSDGDVAAHAACDALLSPAGLGDLGTHFGTAEPRWAGARGGVLLRETAALLAEAGFVVGNVAIQIIGQSPRLAPRRHEAEKVLAEGPGGGAVQVSGTTTAGRRHGTAGRAAPPGHSPARRAGPWWQRADLAPRAVRGVRPRTRSRPFLLGTPSRLLLRLFLGWCRRAPHPVDVWRGRWHRSR